MNSKHCNLCDTDKSISEFGKNNRNKSGLQYGCKKCLTAQATSRYWADPDKFRAQARARKEGTTRASLKRMFSITLEQYNEMVEEQNGVCFLCESECATGSRLSVDHDHSCCPGPRSCGKCIRGLLCKRCNGGLGSLNDDPELLRKAAKYLENGGVMSVR